MQTSQHRSGGQSLPGGRSRPGRRRSKALTALLTGGLVLASLGATVDAHRASAATAAALVPAIHDCDTYEAVQGPNSFAVDFNYSAQLQHWVVPPNVAGGSVCVDVSAGQGGATVPVRPAASEAPSTSSSR